MKIDLSKMLFPLICVTVSACGASESADSDALADATAKAEGPYSLGDVYDDGEFKAKYLGLARLGYGPSSIWEDGECYAFLVDVVRYNDHQNSGGLDTFSPATKGILADGGEADRDASGVGCDTAPLLELGYQSTHKAKLKVGESARIYTGTFRLSEAQKGSLQGVQLYGGSDLFLPEITVEAIANQ
jgi:hypothetical protein